MDKPSISESEILSAYHSYWEAYLNGDMATFAAFLDENVRIIGSSQNDLFTDKKSAVTYYTATANQISGNCEMRNRVIEVLPQGLNVMVQELSDFYLLVGNEWKFYGHGRYSTLFVKKEGQWKIIHQHGSLPDTKVEEGEQVATLKLEKENLELHDAIKRRTVELEHKNHDLLVEASLERVRTIAMGIQKTGDLAAISEVIFTELKTLGFNNLRNTEVIINKHDKEAIHSYYYSDYGVTGSIEVYYAQNPIVQEWAEQLKQSNDAFATVEIAPEQMEQWRKYREEIGYQPDPKLETADAVFYYSYSTGLGALSISSFIQISKAQIRILERFRNVFDLAYRRYLDVEKAEAQAREAEIELALERIRSSAMAMQNSEELSEVAIVMFEQLKRLGGDLFAFGIVLCDKHENIVEQWHALGNEGKISPFFVPIDLDYIHQYRFDQWKAGVELFSIEIPEDYIEQHFDLMFGIPSVKAAMDQLAAGGVEVKVPAWEIDYGASFKYGYLLVSSLKPFDEAHIFPRFARVFSQAYTRFLDLKTAEAQAREAEIETALERLRAASMAMHHSEELSSISFVMFQEIVKLGIRPWNFAFFIFHGQSDIADCFSSDQTGSYPTMVLPHKPDQFLRKTYEDWRANKTLTVQEAKGRALKKHQEYMRTIPGFDQIIKQRRTAGIKTLKKMIFNNAHFKYGYIMINTLEPQTDFWDILQRIAKVFEQTYTRFLDLKKAEAQAREAEIETALERLRAASMAMHHSEELTSTSLVMFQEIVKLGIQPWNFAFFIFHGQSDIADCFSSDQTGSLPTMVLPHKPDKFLRKTYEDWRANKTLTVQEAKGRALKKHQEYMKTIPGFDQIIKQRNTAGVKTLKKMIFNNAHFKYGYIMINTLEPYTDFWDILQRIAKVFEQTYTRFLDLKKAEVQAAIAKKQSKEIELAYENLKATQTQLIQSEKMASLGELTAGIAHEIQNPLNFVNNFSEVNTELIDELVEEIIEGNYDEVIELARDIKSNEEKIKHHGSRADSIVKGMLMHSRTNAGEKTPTDINAMCDEYLRLAYHGLRARDNTFNAKLVTDFDASLGTIDVVAQDISRVILNLITNAFQACGDDGVVKISTKKLEDKIEVSVQDNGSGIPDAIKDKIFQPFFTTKDTGQGTGLGLSLAYDIVKAHGGELRVETKDGEGSVFKILLPI